MVLEIEVLFQCTKQTAVNAGIAQKLDKLQCELNYRIGLEAIDEEIEVSSHYVSNEEADEDYRSTLEQDSNRYETSVIDDYRIHLRKLKTRGYASQAILDYVDKKGAATYM